MMIENRPMGRAWENPTSLDFGKTWLYRDKLDFFKLFF